MKYTKKLFSLFLAVTILLSFTAFNAFAEDDTKSKPKAIKTYEDFLNIAKDLNGDYYLANDITATKDMTPLGDEKNLFCGTLDGKGHAVKNLTVKSKLNSGKTSSYAGIFIYNKGTVKNIVFDNITVNNSKSRYGYTGIVCAMNIGKIENCSFSGKITTDVFDVANYTGSVCGQMYAGSIKHCASSVNIYSKGFLQYVGGISGSMQAGTVSSVFYDGSIFSDGTDCSMDVYAGGITGTAFEKTHIIGAAFYGGIIAEKASNVYLGGVAASSMGEVNNASVGGTVMPSEISSHTYIGAVGEETSNKSKAVYYKKGFTSEQLTTTSGTEVPAKKFTDKSSFKDFDFVNMWKMSDIGPVPVNLPKMPSAELTGIKIVTPPSKIKYIQGDQALNLSGIRVDALYGDKSVTLKTNEFSVSGFVFAVPGKQKITVNYRGFTDSFYITVKKSDENAFSIDDVTDGSYTDGTATDKISIKKNNGTSDNKNPDETTSKNATSSATAGIAPNTVEDTLEDDNGSMPEKTTDGNANTSGNSIGNSSTVSLSEKCGVTERVLCIFAIAVGILIMLVACLVIYFKNKKSGSDTEISVDDLSETENDEADVYKNS